MKRWAGGMVIALCAGAAVAEGWETLGGAAIARALTDCSVTYDMGATQHFYASGRTLYTHGEPSWGSWRVENDQYCSLWPPAPTWDCYDVQEDGAGGVNFVNQGGGTSPGVIAAP